MLRFSPVGKYIECIYVIYTWSSYIPRKITINENRDICGDTCFKDDTEYTGKYKYIAKCYMQNTIGVIPI